MTKTMGFTQRNFKIDLTPLKTTQLDEVETDQRPTSRKNPLKITEEEILMRPNHTEINDNENKQILDPPTSQD